MNYLDLVEELTKAYYDARIHKRNTYNQLEFEVALEHNIQLLAQDIWERTYTLKPSICFIVNRPVKREIFAAHFRDRVVHHHIVGKLNRIFENQFIYDSYSCRVGKGTHFGIKRLSKAMRGVSKNYTKNAYILKLDISGFFMSIHKPTLYGMVEQIVQNKYFGDDKELLLFLIEKVIFNNPTEGCIIKGSKTDWNGLPKNKSLFYANPDCGLPIGNLTSQVFANIYMSGFDRWCKETLDLRYYGRYVDDFYALHTSASFLFSLIERFRQYLNDKLRLTLHPRKIYMQPVGVGVKYLGVVIKPYHKTIVNRTKGNFYEAVGNLDEAPVMSRELLYSVCCSVNSYLGILKHYKTNRIKANALSAIPLVYYQHLLMKHGHLLV